jgi:hypothetical protein
MGICPTQAEKTWKWLKIQALKLYNCVVEIEIYFLD